MARDLNATVAPTTFQNIGIHYSFGTNQLISGNTIDIQGDGVSAGANFSPPTSECKATPAAGMFTTACRLPTTRSRCLNAQSANPQVILGIWENGHAHSSNITVSGNSFTNLAAGNNPATNLQRGFRVTSHSSATSAVTYANNTVMGANIGFQWLAGSNFSGNLPVNLDSNSILGNNTGVLVQSQGLADPESEPHRRQHVAGLNNVDGTVNAENNWWGCNEGPGNGRLRQRHRNGGLQSVARAQRQRFAESDPGLRHLDRHGRHDG